MTCAHDVYWHVATSLRTAQATWQGGCLTGCIEFLGRIDNQVRSPAAASSSHFP